MHLYEPRAAGDRRFIWISLFAVALWLFLVNPGLLLLAVSTRRRVGARRRITEAVTGNTARTGALSPGAGRIRRRDPAQSSPASTRERHEEQPPVTPSGGDPAGGHPAGGHPPEYTPPETTPVETPEETPPETPVETPPGETPVETPPVETPPVETPPVETPPVETPPVETPPVETPPVETPPVTPPVETPPETPEETPVETPKRRRKRRPLPRTCRTRSRVAACWGRSRAPAGRVEVVKATPAEASLPFTGSNTPLLMLVGVAFLGLGLVLHRVSTERG